MAVRWKCPICKKDTEPLIKEFPFCSERCREIDLGNWATEKYVISTPIRPEDRLRLPGETIPEEDLD